MDYEWNARLYIQKAVSQKIEHDIRVIAEAVLHGRNLVIKKGPVDEYPYCKHPEKKFCPVLENAKYVGIVDRKWIFPGNSQLEIYLRIINFFVCKKSEFPFVQPFAKQVEDQVED